MKYIKNMKQKSLDQNRMKFYSLGVVENGGTFKVVDTYMLQKVNQHAQNWRKMDSREVARAMNRGKLLVK